MLSGKEVSPATFHLSSTEECFYGKTSWLWEIKDTILKELRTPLNIEETFKDLETVPLSSILVEPLVHQKL